MTAVSKCRWTGTLVQVVGVFALASHAVEPVVCYWGLLGGAGILLGVAIRQGERPLALLNAAFVISNCLGIYRW